MSDSFTNLNDLLKNVVLKGSGGAGGVGSGGSSSTQQIKLPTLPPNIVPLTEQDLHGLLYQTASPSSSKPSSDNKALDESKAGALSNLSKLPLPTLDTTAQDLQQQLLKFQQQQQSNQFNMTNQPLNPMQQLQKLQQLQQLEQLQKLQYMSQQQQQQQQLQSNSFFNDFQSNVNQQQQSLMNNSSPIQMPSARNDNNNNNRSRNNNNSSNYKSNFLKGTNIDIESLDNASAEQSSSSFNENFNNNIDIYQYISDKHYMPGTASLIEDVDKQLMVILRDGKTLIGYLRSIDQYANLLLSNTIERVYVGNKYGDVPRGVYIVRGENVVLIGEVDFTLPVKVEMIKIGYEEILELQEVELKKQAEAEKNKKRALLNRCLMPQSDSILDDYY